MPVPVKFAWIFIWVKLGKVSYAALDETSLLIVYSVLFTKAPNIRFCELLLAPQLVMSTTIVNFAAPKSESQNHKMLTIWLEALVLKVENIFASPCENVTRRETIN